MGLIGIWNAKPLIDGKEMKQILPYIPRGPAFREVMDEQERWMVTRPGGSKEPLVEYIKEIFTDYTKPSPEHEQEKKTKRKKTEEK